MVDEQVENDRGGASPVRAFLEGRDVPCPLCGYNLRDCKATHCPECGQELVLRVNLVDPLRGAHLAGLIGLACSAGFHALMFILMIVLSMHYSWGDGPGGGYWTYLVAFTILSASLLVTWVKRATAIGRRSHTQRTVLAILCWCVPLAGLVLTALFAVSM